MKRISLLKAISPKRFGIVGTALLLVILLAGVQMFIDYRADIEDKAQDAEALKKSKYLIFVEVEDNMLYLLQDGQCVKAYPCASGKKGTPSPVGTWRIVDKGTWGEGFGGRWMGFNVPWGKYGIHGTMEDYTIGHPLSHGCIRMHNKDVKELYSIIPVGTPVVIVHGSFGPFGSGFRNIDPGERSAAVYAVQKRLKELGYYKGYVSGIYEDDLKVALHKFQKKNGLAVRDIISKKEIVKMGFREFE